jgi:hypothetical protein
MAPATPFRPKPAKDHFIIKGARVKGKLLKHFGFERGAQQPRNARNRNPSANAANVAAATK